MKYIVRYFIDNDERCHPWNCYEYKNEETVVIPRLDEHITLFRTEDDEFGTPCRVYRIEYDLNDDGSGLNLIDIFVSSFNE